MWTSENPHKANFAEAKECELHLRNPADRGSTKFVSTSPSKWLCENGAQKDRYD
jgi:hypothetical protein